MHAYYNEIDPFAAAWLRELIAGGHIAPGDVDERSVADVRPDDLRSYGQCHFFAGIGGWSLALRLAGWDDDRPVWTGSCPCQPFSAAGKGKAADDERHLWPQWLSLIAQRHPDRIFGEQVEAAIGWGWLDLVSSDLETLGYAVGAAVLPAAGVGAPHIRNRVWFVADAMCDGTGSATGDGAVAQAPTVGEHGDLSRPSPASWLRGASGPVADADGRYASPEGLQRGGQHGQQPQDGGTGLMGDASSAGLSQRERDRRVQRQTLEPSAREAAERGSDARALVNAEGEQVGLPGRTREPRSTHWSDAAWLPCTDGKARPAQPGIFPLASGIPNRVGTLRGAGNSIVPQVAAEFIRAAGEPMIPALSKATHGG